MTFRYQHQQELFVAVEGMYTGQFVYCGKKANLIMGNVVPLLPILEGAAVCNVEHHVGDCGVFARDYPIVISHILIMEPPGTSFHLVPRRLYQVGAEPWLVKLPVDTGLRSHC